MNIIKKAKIMDDAKFAIQMISSTNTNVVIMAYHQFLPGYDLRIPRQFCLPAQAVAG